MAAGVLPPQVTFLSVPAVPATQGAGFHCPVPQRVPGGEEEEEGDAAEEWLLLQPRGCFPTELCLVKHVRSGFSLISCLSDELDIGPLGDFCSGGGCLCPGISSLCQCCCRAALGLSLSPVLLSLPLSHLCPDAAACAGFQTLQFTPSWGRDSLSECSVTLWHRDSFRVASLSLLLQHCPGWAHVGASHPHPCAPCSSFAGPLQSGVPNPLTAVQGSASSSHPSSCGSSIPFPFPAQSVCVKLQDAPPQDVPISQRGQTEP